jgi:ATP-binding cassette subfamily C protein
MTEGTAAPKGRLEYRLHSLKSNQSLIFDDPDRLWVVRRGILTVLGTRMEDSAPRGLRRTLFEAHAGRAIFGCAPCAESGNFGLMGVASGRVEVLEVAFADLAGRILAGDQRCAEFLEGWVSALVGVLAEGRETPAGLRRLQGGEAVEFGKDERIATEAQRTLLVEVEEGLLMAHGHPEACVLPCFLLSGPALWLQVLNETKLRTWRLADAPGGAATIGEGLAHLQGLVARHLRQLALEEEKEEARRRAESASLQHRKSALAYNEMASVLDPSERFEARETPLLTTVGIVGGAEGLSIFPPNASEDMSRLKNPIEAIARASMVRCRRVLLGVDWWQRDSGPLVAYLNPEGTGAAEEEDEPVRTPVALLPRAGGYDMVHPERCYRERVTRTLRERIHVEAYMLYRSLPYKVQGVLGLIRFTGRGRLPDMLFVLLMGIIATLLGMVVPKATGTLIDSAIPNADRQLLFELAGLLAAAGITGAIFTWTQLMATVRTGAKADAISQAAMWDRLLGFRPEFFRRFSSGDLQSRTNAVSEISRELNGASLRPLISGVLGLLNWLLLWYYSWELAKLGLWVGLVVLLVTLLIGHLIRRRSWLLHDCVGAFEGMMIQMIGGVGRLRVCGAEHKAFNYWVRRYTDQLHLNLSIQRLQDLIRVFNQGLPPVCTAFIFWKAVELVLDLPIDDEAKLSTGDFIAFNAAFILFLAGLSDVSNTFVSILDNITKGKRIEPLLRGEPEVPADASDPGRLTGHVALESISFRYVEGGPLILDKVSFEVKPGEFVAFVGPSGSGKSTILRILLGFERPEYGRVLYEGQDLSGVNVLAVRRQIGTVLQNGRLSAGSIFDNIANNANITHGEASEAISDAGFSEDIDAMPMGLHTMVSEGGFNLSGGQRQRLLIARALATRPKLVFMDEATSALDNKTQAIVSEALERRRVTRLVIAHRLSTIRKADRIYVLQAGKIVQKGSFRELTATEGLFKDLIARQLA